MDRWVIEVDPRHTIRRIRTAMQGDAVRALCELVKNADDSYSRMENEPSVGEVEVLYRKEGYCGLFGVRDYAEGMSAEDVRTGFGKYGAATSGMKEGKPVGGFFGQGATDALAGMVDGRICAFKDDEFTECRIFIENGTPMGEITANGRATTRMRRMHGIEGNGTVADFKADPEKTGRVPQLSTVHEQLVNNYLLRKIMTDPRRKVVLVDQAAGKRRDLHYEMPPGKEVSVDDFSVTYGGYTFPVHICIWRAELELTQTGDDRSGGLLIVDDDDTVLDVSLFKYDNEPLAARLFGEVKIVRFRDLLIAEEPVLSEERDGLVARHPFCQTLIQGIEERIEAVVAEERKRKQKEAQVEIDPEERARYRKAFSILNEIAETEIQAVTNLGQSATDQPQEPPDGFCLYPHRAEITVGKRYAFELRMSSARIRRDSPIEVACTHPQIRVSPTQVRLLDEDGVGIISKYITVQAAEPNIEARLRATAGDRESEARIYAVAEKELLLSEGMVFQPETVTLRPNQPRRVYLLVYVKMIEGGSTIRLSSDNEFVRLSKDNIVVNEFDAHRHVAKYEVEVWGEGIGQRALITAECEGYLALLEVCIKSKEDDVRKRGKGLFSEPDFNYEPEPLQRVSYSAETGRLIIYVNFPSLRHYLGDDCQYRKTLAAQVLVADLVAERGFQEIASRKVKSSGAALRPEAVPDMIQRDAYALSKKYGKKVHAALVDQKLLASSRMAALEPRPHLEPALDTAGR